MRELDRYLRTPRRDGKYTDNTGSGRDIQTVIVDRRHGCNQPLSAVRPAKLLHSAPEMVTSCQLQ